MMKSMNHVWMMTYELWYFEFDIAIIFKTLIKYCFTVYFFLKVNCCQNVSHLWYKNNKKNLNDTLEDWRIIGKVCYKNMFCHFEIKLNPKMKYSYVYTQETFLKGIIVFVFYDCYVSFAE